MHGSAAWSVRDPCVYPICDLFFRSNIMSSTPVAAASVGSPGAADAVRQLFGDRPSPISPPSSGLPAPPTAPTARPEPMRSFIATPAPADRISQLTAQMAEMMMAMQGMMEEVKRLTAALEPPATSATYEPSHTREVPVSQVSLTESFV